MPQFIIMAEDFKDADALNRRLAVRTQHLIRMREEKSKGKFIMGGARLDEQGAMCGSMLVVQLPDEASVRQWVDEDPYVKNKVWENIQVLPFRIAEV